MHINKIHLLFLSKIVELYEAAEKIYHIIANGIVCSNS